MNVRSHFGKGSGQNGGDDDVGASQGGSKIGCNFVAPFPGNIGAGGKSIPDTCIGFGRRLLYVIETHNAAQGFFIGQIAHEGPGPAA